MEQLTTFPAEFTAGDTFDLLVSESDYPASDGWSLTYALRGGGAAIDLTSVASGDSHLVQKASSLTSAWTAGVYRAYKRAVHATLGTYSLGYTTVTILPDPTTLAAAADVRSHARKVLESIEAVLEGRASTDQQEMSFDAGGVRRSLKRMTIDELLKLRSVYQQHVSAEEARESGTSTGGFFSVQFSFGGSR